MADKPQKMNSHTNEEHLAGRSSDFLLMEASCLLCCSWFAAVEILILFHLHCVTGKLFH